MRVWNRTRYEVLKIDLGMGLGNGTLEMRLGNGTRGTSFGGRMAKERTWRKIQQGKDSEDDDDKSSRSANIFKYTGLVITEFSRFAIIITFKKIVSAQIFKTNNS